MRNGIVCIVAHIIPTAYIQFVNTLIMMALALFIDWILIME